MKSMKRNNSQHLLKNSPWASNKFGKIILSLCIGFIVVLFLPWTQNIQANGFVTTLNNDERPQEIQSAIAGRLTKWHVKEGDYINLGDTIALLGEIKSEYLNPELIKQTEIQIQAKENSLLSYNSKINAINEQIKQLEINRNLSIQKAKNKFDQENLKLQAESADYEAAKLNTKIAKQQLERDSILLAQKIKSPMDVENKRVKYQETVAKLFVSESKVRQAKASIANAKIELQNLDAEYGEKLSKGESDRYSAISAQMEVEAEVSKLRNTMANYSIRNGFYVITAPKSGYVTRTKVNGIGETIKEGETICQILPKTYESVVELFIDPVDMPLVHDGVHVQFTFDGWPTMVFSGWPNLTYGTFPGVIYGVNSSPNENGKYRVLVKQRKDLKPWPNELKIGVGARGYLLLKKVPIWYELWRIISGFSPDYYLPQKETPSKK